LKKIVGEAPISSVVYASKTRIFYSVCKNFGAQRPLSAKIWFSEKVDLGRKIAPLNLSG